MIPPIAGGVLPKDQPMALKGLLKTVVNAFHFLLTPF